jgi:hypothetical protein
MSPAGYGLGNIDFFTFSPTNPSARWQASDVGGFTADHIFYTNQLNNPGVLLQRMVIKGGTGNIGIGAFTPQYAPQHLLHVLGTIGAEEVIVSSNGADYVFAPDYPLKPLNEVKQYIQEYHHLPDIPSEAEVKQKGVGLGELQAKLLAKIEELTLHMIQTEENNRELQARIARLETTGGTKVPQ